MLRQTALICVSVAASSALAFGDVQTIDRIVREVKTNSKAVDTFRHLTTVIGARRTGSQALQRSQEWAAGLLKSYGLTNVALEQWGTVPIGFERGRDSFGRMVKPYAADFQISTPAWTAGTTGPVRAEAVLQPSTLAELETASKSLAGKWILMRRSSGMRSRVASPEDAALAEVDKKLDEARIAGRVYGGASNEDLLQTHGSWQGLTYESRPTIPRVTIRASDMRRVQRQIIAGEKVELEFNLDQRFVQREVPQYNVVGDIVGSEKPDEMVIVGAHIDSWDGPGSQGASDNGTGTSAVIEAARLLAASGAKPKRTIRFVLFGGEEQGLLGSSVNAKNLGDRLEKVSAMINEDNGSNRQVSITVWTGQVDMMKEAIRPFNEAFPNWALTVRGTDTVGRSGGSDHASYASRGVPAFMFGKEGPQRYGFIWHTQNDTFENAIPDNVRQMSANMALMAYNLACAPSLLPRPAKPAPATQ